MPDPNTNNSPEEASLQHPSAERHAAHTRAHAPGRHARLLWFLLIPAVLLAFGLYRWRSDAKAHKALTSITTAGVAESVTVQQPQYGQSISDLVLPATLQAFSESPIYARTSGYVSRWFTDIGRSVAAGEVLATIDSPEVDQQLIQARAALGQSEANLQLANTTTQRYKDLIKSDSVAQQEVDQNVQNLTSQQQAVVSGRANVANLAKQQSYERVLAPFSGVVTERRIDVGHLINAGNSGSGAELFRISRIDVMRIFVAVPEEYSQQMQPGLHAQVRLTELPDQPFDGIIARSNHAIDPNTRTLTVEVDVANKGGKLLPGAYGSVHFKLVQAHRPLLVPTGGVLFQEAGPQVAVVTPQNQVSLHKVAIGRDLGSTIEITGGLSPLDRIISSPPDYLVNGMPVSVQATPAPQGSQPAAAPGKSVGPNYHPAAVPTPPAFQEPTDEFGAGHYTGTAWWTVFSDPTLNDLEIQAVAANFDIRIGIAQIDRADGYRRSIRSQESPQITANPSVSRTREAQQRPNNGNTGGKAATYNDVQLPLVLNYEIDAWGRIRRMVTSAAEAQQATEADLRFIRLTATTGVAASYFTLREADAEIGILGDTIGDLQRGYDITNNQFRRGLISALAPAQAKTILDQTNGRVEALHIVRSQSEHAIAALLGRPVEGFTVAVDPGFKGPPEIPAGLPADVLKRRPDVIEAERYAASASEQIGVAKAAYFPQLSLTGLTGFESANPGSIFAWQNTIANLAANAAAPVFTGGRLRANVDQAKAAYQQSVLQYEKTVVTSYQEVEDQLAALHDLSREYTAEQTVITDATKAEQIANNRFQAGLVSYLDVVYAQQTLLQNQETTAQVQGSASRLPFP